MEKCEAPPPNDLVVKIPAPTSNTGPPLGPSVVISQICHQNSTPVDQQYPQVVAPQYPPPVYQQYPQAAQQYHPPVHQPYQQSGYQQYPQLNQQHLQPPTQQNLQPGGTTRTAVMHARPTDLSGVRLCPHCQVNVSTTVEHKLGLLVWIIFGSLFICGIWPFCLIPFCMSSCKDVEHSCPNCSNILHIYKRV